MVQIRAEEPDDWDAVRAVNTSTFETPAEAKLVDALRRQANPVVSLVAEDDNTIVGHIMFSPASLATRRDLKIMGLAPMAVTPRRQRQGIGSALVGAGLEHCRRLGIRAVVVLGHPGYYSRFGFLPAMRFGLGCEYAVPEDAFMVLELLPGFLAGASGIVKYDSAFDSL